MIIVLAWLTNNAVTVIASAVVLAAVGMAVAVLAKDKKRGSGACTGNCASCRMGCASAGKDHRA
ncbi:MAG: FeoB-associated Cys-rich membrane protein [Oscillospiraceae bacterium]|nr:FeoB-associated Cys-rich membrane protein [Oscillospiraceae bacterium]